MSLFDDKYKIIDDAEAQLVELFASYGDEVQAALKDKLYDFDIKDGKFVNDKKAPIILSQLRRKLQQILNTPEFKTKINKWLRNFNAIEKNTIGVHENYNSIRMKPYMFDALRKTAVDQIVQQIVGSGMLSKFIEPLSQALMRNIVLGSTISDTMRYLKAFSTGPDSALYKYASEFATDAIHQYDGMLNQYVQDKFEMDAIQYIGSLIETSRPICIHIVNQMDSYILTKDLQALINKYRDKRGSGMYEQTNADNFCVYRGGYHCRHSAIPTFAGDPTKVQQAAQKFSIN